MSGLRTRLERLEARVAGARCIWLYAGWKHRGGLTAAGDGVSRVFVPALPPALPPGLLVILRHPDPGGAEVGAAVAAWALAQLALGPFQRALIARARILVLVTAGGSGPPPGDEADDAAPPGAAAGPPPAAEGPPPPAAASPLPVPPRWPEWLPR
jgi:hypothetical protein